MANCLSQPERPLAQDSERDSLHLGRMLGGAKVSRAGLAPIQPSYVMVIAPIQNEHHSLANFCNKSAVHT
jgi:hypothetical protein